MAYEKYTWVDGELITAEKLNHIEDGIAEGGEAGYECTETTEQLFTETVTTVERDGVCMAQLAYSNLITADELTVIFNGTEYVCPKSEDGDNAFYGGFDLDAGRPDFTNYPFAIISGDGANGIATESPMTVTVSASVSSIDVETTECFEKAVQNVNSVLVVNMNKTEEGGEEVRTLDKTWQEIFDACSTRGAVVKRVAENTNALIPITQIIGGSGTYSVIIMSDEFTTESPNDYPTNGGGK